jgi:regulator of nucleoside diphosphate kinase
MKPYIATIVVLGLYTAGVLLVLFIGRLLVRTRLRRRWAAGERYSPSRIVEDVRPLQKAEDRSPAIITPADYRELTSAIVAAKKLAMREPQTRILLQKLANAVISVRSDLPPDVITMHTRAELVDLDTDERLNLMLVFPIDASLEDGRISVFDPLGAAMLGRRIGDQLRWAVPYGVRRFEVKAVHFQPETALAQAA